MQRNSELGKLCPLWRSVPDKNGKQILLKGGQAKAGKSTREVAFLRAYAKGGQGQGVVK